MRWLAFSLLAMAAPAVAAPAPALLQIAGCDREAAEWRGTVRHRVVLDRRFLDPAISDEEHLRRAVLQQLRYLWGYLRTNTEGGSAHKTQLVLSAEAPAITWRSREAGTYGRELVLDWQTRDPRLVIDDDYTKRAVAGGAAHADDPALVGEYTAEVKLAMCDEPRPARSTIAVPMPDDPWLLYWHVPAQNRRLMRYLDEPPVVTNPCSDDDFADLPHPFYYWYDWQPERHGPDREGRDFDCRQWLHAGVDYTRVTVELERAATPSPDFRDLRAGLSGSGPLKATVLIGVLDHEVKDPRLPSLLAKLGAGRALAETARATLDSALAVERGTRFFLAFLRDLGDLVEVSAWKAALEGGYLAVTASGTLRASRRAVELHVLVGMTDIFGPLAPQHWRILRRALAEDQVIVYAGHSGLGENFRLARVAEGAGLARGQLATEIARAPFQLVAFLSCYSYMYFGQDLLAATPGKRELVYTGTEFTKGDRGALAVLSLVDEVLAKPESRPSLRYVEPRDFLIVEEYSRSTP